MGDSGSEAWVAGLEPDRASLGRGSIAEGVAGILRERVSQGLVPPGARLSEEAIGAALGVSRNTLREAFRILTHERLLVHQVNRGVFVRTLVGADVVELYRLRRLVEGAAVRELASASEHAIATVRRAVEDGERAARHQHWSEVASADLHFHQGIVSLAGSRRLEELMLRVHAELRLAFHAMGNPRRFHESYLARNREILTALEARDTRQAGLLLSVYLADAERQLLQAFDDLSDSPGAAADEGRAPRPAQAVRPTHSQ